MSAEKLRVDADLVVLATGMVASDGEIDGDAVRLDKDRFVVADESAPGIFVAGCARGPVDVATATADATAAALKAIQTIRQSAGRRPAALA